MALIGRTIQRPFAGAFLFIPFCSVVDVGSTLNQGALTTTYSRLAPLGIHLGYYAEDRRSQTRRSRPRFMNPLEIAAVAFSFPCVALAARRNAWCWPPGTVGASAYLLPFYQAKLYAGVGLQAVFLAQNIYGWRYWTKKDDQRKTPRIRALGRRARGVVAITILGMTLGFGAALQTTTDASFPHLDTLLASTGLLANGMQARKILENWILWILADVFYIGMFIHKGMFVSASLYLILLALSTQGLVRWFSDYKALPTRANVSSTFAAT